jgi:hypothetical protein
MRRKVIKDLWNTLLGGEERKIVMLLESPARPSDSSTCEALIKIRVAEFLFVE